jgi:hypothetical protein
MLGLNAVAQVCQAYSQSPIVATIPNACLPSRLIGIDTAAW